MKKRSTWRARFNPIRLRARYGSKLKFGLIRYLLYLIGAFFVLSIILFTYYSKDLPNPNKIRDRDIAQSTKIYDREGKILYEFHGEENRTIIKKEEIPENVRQATIAIEDKNFYRHQGVDVGGIFKAIGRKLLGRKARLGGGSTITQQYIKNALLTNRRSLSRKIQELILSLEIEQIYSKDEILTGYLNQIPYGNNAYGIEAAARTYFDKPAKDLTLSEASLLAALPQAPSYYLAHPDDLIGRKNHVLDLMVEQKMVKRDEAEIAKKAAPNKENINLSSKISNIRAPHFVFYIRDQLLEMLGGGAEAELKLMTTGYKVQTTLDSRMQKAAEEAVAKYKDKLSGYGAKNAALTAIDPKTGQILAMVGSIDFTNEEFGSVNVTNSPRQPGSSFKPIVYATGFKKKYNPAFTLWDVPTRLDANKSENWPNNYDRSFNGPLTVRQALQWSLNVPAVKMLHLVGLKNALETASDLGISTLNADKDYGLSLVLGSGEVKLVELTGAYATFANNGKHNPITPILKIEDPKGKVIKEFKEEGKQALDPQVAYQISHVLSDDATRSARWGKTALRLNNRHNVAAKTGTTSSFKDAWTIGYTRQLAAGVWVGNNNAKPMKTGADGLIIAAPIWNYFMQQALDGGNMLDEAFPRPEGIKELAIEKFSNKLPSQSSPADSIVTDVLASWQIPKEKDDVHVKVKVDKITGKLATDFTPSEFIEERYYTVIHSEIPDNPTWEQPVRDWAASHGLSDSPPTDKDDIHLEGNKPVVEFTSVSNNQVVNGALSITARVSGPYRTTLVEYFIDNNFLGSATEVPYQANFDTTTLGPGDHQLRAKATNELGLTDTEEITIKIKTDNVPPGDVSSVTVTPSNQAVTLQWHNPSDLDFSYVAIYISTEQGKLGSKFSQNVFGQPGGQSNQKIEGLISGTNYYFTLHPVDKTGNENQSFSQYSAKPS